MTSSKVLYMRTNTALVLEDLRNAPTEPPPAGSLDPEDPAVASFYAEVRRQNAETMVRIQAHELASANQRIAQLLRVVSSVEVALRSDPAADEATKALANMLAAVSK
jgi:hypothetical protein